MAARTVSEIADLLVAFVNREIMAPGHAIEPDDRFDAAGVEQELGVAVPDEDLVDDTVASAATLARYLAGRLAAA